MVRLEKQRCCREPLRKHAQLRPDSLNLWNRNKQYASSTEKNAVWITARRQRQQGQSSGAVARTMTELELSEDEVESTAVLSPVQYTIRMRSRAETIEFYSGCTGHDQLIVVPQGRKAVWVQVTKTPDNALEQGAGEIALPMQEIAAEEVLPEHGDDQGQVDEEVITRDPHEAEEKVVAGNPLLCLLPENREKPRQEPITIEETMTVGWRGIDWQEKRAVDEDPYFCKRVSCRDQRQVEALAFARCEECRAEVVVPCCQGPANVDQRQQLRREARLRRVEILADHDDDFQLDQWFQETIDDIGVATAADALAVFIETEQRRDAIVSEEDRIRSAIQNEQELGFAEIQAEMRRFRWMVTHATPLLQTLNKCRLVEDPHVRARGITLASFVVPGVHCQESAIRAAALLVGGDSIMSDVRTGMNLTEFVEYLHHLRLEVPVFVAGPKHNLPRRADGSVTYVYTQVNTVKMNKERWSIVFFPDDPAHYSLLQLMINDVEQKRAVVATTLPLDPTDGVFWRAMRTPQNSDYLDVMIKLGLACDCPVTCFQCKHELQYGCDERVLVGRECQGWKIAEVVANPLSTWMCIPVGLGVHVISPQEELFVEDTCCNMCSSSTRWQVKTHAFDLSMTRFSLRVFERNWRVPVIDFIVPAIVSTALMTTFMGVGSLFTNRADRFVNQCVEQVRLAHQTELHDLARISGQQMGLDSAMALRDGFSWVWQRLKNVYGFEIPRLYSIDNLYGWTKGFLRGMLGFDNRRERLIDFAIMGRWQSMQFISAYRRHLILGSLGLFSVWATRRMMPHTRWFWEPQPARVTSKEYVRAATTGIPHLIPDYHVFVNKIVTVRAPTEAVVLDALRRHNQMQGNKHPLNSSIVTAIVERTAAVVGEAVVVLNESWACQTCGRRARLHQHECKECRNARRLPLYTMPTFTLSYGTRHVGFVGIYATEIRLPDLPVREGFKCRFRGLEITTVAQATHLYERLKLQSVCYGRLCAVMIMGCHVSCYPRGVESGLMAFVGRMSPDLGLTFDQRYLPVMLDLLYFMADMADMTVGPLIEWTDEEVLANQRDAKKREVLRAAQMTVRTLGMLPLARLRRYDAFPKFEKHVAVEWVDGGWQRKSKQIPRLINSPDVQVNALLAPYTLPMLKWVGKMANENANVFYAGGANPEQLNVVLNRMIDAYDYYVEDDISMIDASHTKGTFQFHALVRRLMWPGLSSDIENLFRALEKLTVKAKAGGVQGEVPVANASGIPMTSYNNSLLCCVLRTLAIAYASYDVELTDLPGLAFGARMVLSTCMQCFAGDDGLVGMCGIGRWNPLDPEWIIRYSRFWANCGFKVSPEKVKILPRSRRRMMTFLGMRPFWSGQRYEWGPEIARRLKTMFWQLDNSMQPFVWARGVASSLLTVGRHVPVTREICDFVMHVAPGPTAAGVVWTNDYSTFRNYEVTGDITPRTIDEFLTDYGVEAAEYEDFRAMLRQQTTVLIDIHHVVLQKIMALE